MLGARCRCRCMLGKGRSWSCALRERCHFLSMDEQNRELCRACLHVSKSHTNRHSCVHARTGKSILPAKQCSPVRAGRSQSNVLPPSRYCPALPAQHASADWGCLLPPRLHPLSPGPAPPELCPRADARAESRGPRPHRPQPSNPFDAKRFTKRRGMTRHPGRRAPRSYPAHTLCARPTGPARSSSAA